MPFDVRVPIGLLFSILGALLVVYGLFTTHSEMYARSLGLNVNLGWGAVLLLFGLVMLLLTRKTPEANGARGPGEPPSSSDGSSET